MSRVFIMFKFHHIIAFETNVFYLSKIPKEYTKYFKSSRLTCPCRPQPKVRRAPASTKPILKPC
jgi:hypothetical protein